MNKQNLDHIAQNSLSNINRESTITTAIVERIFLDIKESPFGADFIKYNWYLIWQVYLSSINYGLWIIYKI